MADLVKIRRGMSWPPEADKPRLANYARYQRFFRGKHQDAFRYLGAKCEDGSGIHRRIYIICNYAGLMSRKCADFLVGEPPTYLATGDKVKADALQPRLDFLASRNKLTPLLYRLECALSYRGDGVLRVRDNGRHAVIESVPAHRYFVRANPDDCTEIEAEAIVWTRQLGENKWVCRVEHHLPGTIVQEAFLAGKPGPDGVFELKEQLSLDQLGEDLPEVQLTGVNRSLLQHVPNFQVDDELWGISDYDDLDAIFEAINNRLSKIDAYLDRHSRPKLIGLAGMADQAGNVDPEQDYFEPIDPELGKSLPRYVTWEGQMIAAFKEFEILEDQLFRLSEMAPAMFGLDKAGSIESARAMKLRFVNPRAKLNRKRALLDPQLREALHILCEVDHLRYNGPDPDGVDIDIRWQDGIPEDYSENIDAEARRIESGTSSRQSAIQRIDRVTPQQALEELTRIRFEQQPGETREAPGQAGETPGETGESGSNARPQLPGTGNDL